MWRFLSVVTLLALAGGCRAAAPPTSDSAAANEPAAQAAQHTPAEEESAIRVVMLGDSLTAGLGLSAAEAYPALVEEELRARGWSVELVNAGVSGDTSAGGRSRLGWLLKQKPQVVVVALGANDGLRGLSVERLERNLVSIITRSREAGARVLLAGIRMPPSHGPEYAERFDAVFPRVAAELDVPLMPFLLEDVGGVAQLNLPDGIHPNARGQEIIAGNVVPHLERVLERLEGQDAA